MATVKVLTKLFAVAIAAVSSAASAQDYHPSTLGVGIGNWELKPILSRVDGVDSVASILALAKPGTTFGDNLVGVLYTRGTTAGSWTSSAWQTCDSAAIIRKLKSSYGISDDEDPLWGVDPSIDLQSGVIAVSPEEYASGLLTSNLLYSFVASSTTQAQLVSALKMVGYQAADPTFEKADFGCLSGIFLDQVSAVAEQASANMDLTSNQAFAELTKPNQTCSGATSGTMPVSTVIIDNPTRWSLPGYTPGGVAGCWGFPSTTGNSYYTRTTTESRSRTCGSWGPNGTYVFCSQTRTVVHCKVIFCIVTCPGTPQPPTPPCSSPIKSIIPEWLTTGTSDTGWVGVNPAGCSC